ncbi:MAG: hypothetical protein A3G18_10280 [Rhodospirillales bacterium RIFCSPLOWO2_12_FULL_58_28]|nr:MAG: hypothetical protein A3H92_08455 [Rhodospirillales bacterium RIFCSPLOWO2_02_FULL_58_16]OHC77707.1 MAG: hypothetical protein A3G18_10280 [Rhodospirillales bacterium RIFCSPLOWO2_12_FULL_58_28]
MAPGTPPNACATALVVFGGEAQLKWLRVLKPGFRHCFIALKNSGRWVICNPLSHQTEISVHHDFAVDELAERYRKLGFKVIICAVHRAPLRAAPWRPYTCVEAVKRVLGIHNGRILTPWQLYRHLQSRQ